MQPPDFIDHVAYHRQRQINIVALFDERVPGWKGSGSRSRSGMLNTVLSGIQPAARSIMILPGKQFCIDGEFRKTPEKIAQCIQTTGQQGTRSDAAVAENAAAGQTALPARSPCFHCCHRQFSSFISIALARICTSRR